MFKKALDVTGTNLLSKKDVKKLKGQILEAYPSIDEATVDTLLPGDVKVSKLSSRTLLYAAGDGAPMFFDLDGRGEMFPTLAALWQVPQMMMELTIHPPVSQYILRGADLMLQGVILPANGVVGLGTVEKQQPRCVRIEGNPYAVCIGKMLVNQNGMEKMKGPGLTPIHIYGDELWALCGRVVPNRGFSSKPDEIEPCTETTAESDGKQKPEGKAEASDEGAAAVAAIPASPGAKSDSAAPEPEGGAGQAPAGGGGAEPAFDSMSQDELLEFCFLKALRTTLADDSLLPVPASDFQEKHLYACRPAGTTVDVKKSSHKQLGKFLNHMRKQKLIEIVDKKGAVSITKVMRGHKDLVGFEAKYGTAASPVEVAETAEKGKKSSGSSSKRPPPVVSTKWKASHYLEKLFKECGLSKSELYGLEKLQGCVKEYLERKELLKDEVVTLDDLLLDSLIKVAGGKKKDAPDDPTEISLEDLHLRLQDRLVEHTVVEVPGVDQVARKGPLQNIQISLSQKGAHNVTKILGLEVFCVDPEPLAQSLKTVFSCTTSVEELPGKSTKDKVLQVQGHVAQEFIAYIGKEFGIPKKYVDVK